MCNISLFYTHYIFCQAKSFFNLRRFFFTCFKKDLLCLAFLTNIKKSGNSRPRFKLLRDTDYHSPVISTFTVLRVKLAVPDV